MLGTFLIVVLGCVTCYTSRRLLVHEKLEDPRLRSYVDVVCKAFPKSSELTNILFLLELFSLSVTLIMLGSADSSYSVWPAHSAGTHKLSFLLM
ncbi:hypothetical protein EDC04DRAFT_2560396 [Pisolithus marmoratus]|nr:hypothetical protein EDC04DRAFT_2560396 [Pisolithus marmoratus]